MVSRDPLRVLPTTFQTSIQRCSSLAALIERKRGSLLQHSSGRDVWGEIAETLCPMSTGFDPSTRTRQYQEDCKGDYIVAEQLLTVDFNGEWERLHKDINMACPCSLTGQ